jgi:RND family efflux transporter MFP subunit
MTDLAPTNKSKIVKVMIPIIALTMLLIMVAWLAGAFDQKVAPSLNSQATNATINQQNIYKVTEKTSAIFEPVAASIEAKQATIISSRILARINNIDIRSGDTVKKGDVLIELEQHDLASQVLQAQQNVNAMQARHKEAKQNYDRSIELFKKSLVSEFERDKNRADYQSIVAELTAAEQSLSQAETALSYATLLAPIDGRIVDRFAEPGDTAQPGTKLISLYNPLSLRVEAQVRESLAVSLKHGQTITIALPTLKQTLTGEIEEIVPAANTGSRSFLIKARISVNRDLLPGMYARMLVPAGEEKTISIPQSSVSHVGQLNFVWLNINGQKQRRIVRLGKAESDNMIRVISGLQIDDEVLTL